LRTTRQDGDKWYDTHDRFVNRKDLYVRVNRI
jgi:hypothetical protein